MSKVIKTIALLLSAIPSLLSAQDWQTLSQSRKYSGEDALKVDVQYAAGRLSMSPTTDGTLYKSDLRYDADIFKRPVMSYGNGALKVSLSDGNVKGRNMKAGRLDLAFGSRTPLDVHLQFGAAEATLDLGGLRIQRAKIETGASQTMLRVSKPNPIVCEEMEISVGAARFEAVGLGNLNVDRLKVSGGVGEVVLDFSGTARRDVTAEVDMGLGSLVLRIPRSTGLKVTKNGLLASFDSQGMVKKGDAFYSENWKSAAHHVTVAIDAAFGSITVEWLDR